MSRYDRSRSGGNTKVDLNLCKYATKTDLRNSADIKLSNLVAKFVFASSIEKKIK